MGSNIVLAFLILFLLSWTFIITGSARASTYTPEATIVKELLTVGGALALLFIMLLVVKITLLDMMRPVPLTIKHFSNPGIISKN
jgi:hypothetical protein